MADDSQSRPPSKADEAPPTEANADTAIVDGSDVDQSVPPREQRLSASSASPRTLLTDSMCTVRLSDSQSILSTTEQVPTTSEEVTEAPKRVESDTPIDVETSASEAPVEDGQQQFSEDVSKSESPSGSIMMQSSVEDLPHDDNTVTMSSRSSGSDSETIEGTMGVDWDGLGRSEEQEPRDEGSDEVRRFSTSLCRDNG